MSRFSQRCILVVALAGTVTALVFHAGAHANAPPGRYSGSGGIVLDSKTKLTWQQSPASSGMTWANAKTYCTGVGSMLGGTGWRLPTAKELLTLVDYSQATQPLIDQSAFAGTSDDNFWSSTPAAGSSLSAWSVDFADGTTFANDPLEGIAVRCVR